VLQLPLPRSGRSYDILATFAEFEVDLLRMRTSGARSSPAAPIFGECYGNSG
jgi:hypothetical protein